MFYAPLPISVLKYDVVVYTKEGPLTFSDVAFSETKDYIGVRNNDNHLRVFMKHSITGWHQMFLREEAVNG